MAILETYVPKQMNEEEIRKIIGVAIQNSGALDISEFGKVMGLVMKEINENADGNVVSRIVKEELIKIKNSGI